LLSYYSIIYLACRAEADTPSTADLTGESRHEALDDSEDIEELEMEACICWIFTEIIFVFFAG